jgi:hypothetical protein
LFFGVMSIVRRFILKPTIFAASLSAILLLTTIWLPNHYDYDYPRPVLIQRDSGVDEDLVQRFADRQADLVLLGNSMVGLGLDEALADSLMEDRVQKIGIHGAASAVWYLVLKNVVCATEHRPGVVVLFYRDIFLTYAEFRVDGKYLGKVDTYAHRKEPLLDRLAYGRDMGMLEAIAMKWLPIYGERIKLKDEMVSKAKYGVPHRLLGNNSKLIDQAIAVTFSDSNMNSELLTAAQLSAEDVVSVASQDDFSARVDVSFLPAIIELMADNDIELVLVRYKRRRDLKSGARSAVLESYFRDLDSYLDTQGVAVLDYSDNETIKLEHFGEGDHLNEQGREVFTHLVVDDLIAAGMAGSIAP